MDLKESHFKYTATLKREQEIVFEGLELFPGLNEISFSSRIFSNYAECVKSCKGMMNDMTTNINQNLTDTKFKVGAEVNPEHTGTPTLSKDWGESEVARFWIYDKAMEGTGSKINAICRGSIIALPKVASEIYMN